MKAKHLFLAILFFCSTRIAISQSISIIGPTTVQSNEIAYYEVQMDYFPWSTVYWNIIGGTILSQNGNWNNGMIYVWVQWDNIAGNGAVNITDYNQDPWVISSLPVEIGMSLEPGWLSSNINYFNSQNTPVVTTYPATSAVCTNMNYHWEYSYDGVNWGYLGSTEAFPGISFDRRVLVRRYVECDGRSGTTNTLEFNYKAINSENRNYVRTNEVWYPGKTTFIAADDLPIGQKQQSTTYFDGLGRSEQSLNMGVTVNHKDLVTPFYYDELGRESRKYLPYESPINDGMYKANAATEQANYYSDAIYGKFPGQAPYYSASEFDHSPLNVVTKTLAPGAAWGGSQVGATANLDLNTKNGDAVRIWRVDAYDPNSLPVSNINDTYDDNTLYKTTATDENGKKVIEYKDMDGNVILKKQQLADVAPDLSTSHTGWLCTYYVYDDFRRLRYVLSPKAVERLNGLDYWTVSSQMVKGLCFKYVYDEKGRLIEKQVPDADPVQMVYDNRDRLVFSQDGNQRAGKANDLNYPEWSFFVYDDQNRQVLSGSMVENNPGNSRSFLQTTMNSLTATSSVIVSYQADQTESKTVFNPVPNMYSNLIPYYENRINIINSYDNANTAYTLVTFPYPDNFENIDPATNSTRTRGMVVLTKVRVFDGNPNRFISTASYYDEKARLIQTSSQNYLGAIVANSMQYDFSGKVRSTIYTETNRKRVGGKFFPLFETDAYSIVTKNEYDHAGRLSAIKKNFTNTWSSDMFVLGPNPRILTTGERTVVENSYDELGQLISKKLAPGYSNPNGNNYLEKQDFNYNIRGWITAINKDYCLGGTGSFFGMQMGYDAALPGSMDPVFSHSYLNGNISGITWKSAGNNTLRMYDYAYDNANRLTFADFGQKNTPIAKTWAKDKFDFTVSGLSYDPNGNILTMNQKGVDFSGIVDMDKLTYGYGAYSNQLNWVAEDIANNTKDYKLGDFTDRNPGVGNLDYVYDKNGNMVTDNNKSIGSIVYNTLNLPKTVNVQANSKVEYFYDATGYKHQKKVTDNTGSISNKVTTTTYSGPIIYGAEGNTMNFEEGRVRFTKDGYGNYSGLVFDYYIKDYLGSVRMVLTEETGSFPYPVATMEMGSMTLEDNYYVISNRTDKPVELQGNIDPNLQSQYDQRYGDKMSKLTSLAGGNKVGPSVLLKVMAGDAVHAKTDYYYQTDGSQVNSNSLVQDLANNLLLHLLTGQAGTTAKAQATTISNNVQGSSPISGVNGLIDQQNNSYISNKPKAYLNYIVFDEQFNVVSKGFQQVQTAGPLQAPLAFTSIPITQNGWIYVFDNNESEQPVYFDNFQVVHVKGNILEEDHYYPFGLTIKAISAKSLGSNGKNQIKYNSKELQTEEFENGSGLEEYDYGARYYEPQIGRWNVPDPKAEKAYDLTPFRYGFNNPIRFVDPNGEWEFQVISRPDGSKYVVLVGQKGDNLSTLAKQTGLNAATLQKDFTTTIYGNHKIDQTLFFGENYQLTSLGSQFSFEGMNEALNFGAASNTTCNCWGTALDFGAKGKVNSKGGIEEPSTADGRLQKDFKEVMNPKPGDVIRFAKSDGYNSVDLDENGHITFLDKRAAAARGLPARGDVFGGTSHYATFLLQNDYGTQVFTKNGWGASEPWRIMYTNDASWPDYGIPTGFGSGSSYFRYKFN